MYELNATVVCASATATVMCRNKLLNSLTLHLLVYHAKNLVHLSAIHEGTVHYFIRNVYAWPNHFIVY